MLNINVVHKFIPILPYLRLNQRVSSGHYEITYITVMKSPRQKQNICITFIQCWSNVEDVGPTLYKCYTNVL